MGIISLLKEKISQAQNSLVDATGYEYISQIIPDPENTEDTTILKIPGYRQTKNYTCGFVAGLMVLHKFKPKASATNFYYLCNPDREQSTSTGNLVRALRKNGVRVSIKKNMTFEQISDALENNMPVIMEVKRTRGITHWVVIFGYAVGPNRLYVAGNNLLGTEYEWSKFKKMIATNGDWLVCSKKS